MRPKGPTFQTRKAANDLYAEILSVIETCEDEDDIRMIEGRYQEALERLQRDSGQTEEPIRPEELERAYFDKVAEIRERERWPGFTS